ncbi:MAG: hypothetical protein ACRD0O_18595, partial [Acidimicrobiia bacterium]
MSPAPRLAWLLAAVSLSALVIPPGMAVLGGLGLVAAAVVDLVAIRAVPRVARTAPHVMARGVRSALVVEVEAPGAVRVRQPVPPDLGLVPSEADGRLDGSLLPRRRGRHVLPVPAVRVEGRLGLARVTSRTGEEAEVLVYPDLPAAHRLVTAVRQGRFRDPGLLTRGPLGLGTDFESIRDYLPDDDIRQ